MPRHYLGYLAILRNHDHWDKGIMTQATEQADFLWMHCLGQIKYSQLKNQEIHGTIKGSQLNGWVEAIVTDYLQK